METAEVRSRHCTIRKRVITIRRLLKDNKLAGPHEIEALNRAYRDAMRSLHLVDRKDPIAEIVAKAVIEIGATGVSNPSEITKIVVKRFATRQAKQETLLI